nr:MAG TPA: hypothetical protein [Caudoviricetes sp.]
MQDYKWKDASGCGSRRKTSRKTRRGRTKEDE